MPLQSLFTDEWFSPWADDFTLATQFVIVASQSFFQEKISSRWAFTFIWQFNSISLLCLCNLSLLMKKFPWVDALLWYFISIWHHCCVFIISLFLGKKSWWVCAFSLAIKFNIVAVSLQCNLSFLAMICKCENARGFVRKHHLLRKFLDSSCTEILNLDWKDRLRY